MKRITSVHNDEIKAVAHLLTVKGREMQRKFMAEGVRVCSTLISSGYKPVQIYVTESMLNQSQELGFNSLITLVDDHVLAKISSTKTPSGMAAVFPIPPLPSPEHLNPGIVLYAISDPGNMGTLLRSCAAMGKKSIVVINGVDPWSPKVVQASAGTIGSLDIFEWSWQTLIQNKKKLTLCALVVSGGKSPDNFDFSDMLFMVGNEAHGIPEETLRQCDNFLTLAMPGNAESLNVAVAGSIVMYLAWHKSS